MFVAQLKLGCKKIVWVGKVRIVVLRSDLKAI